MNEKIKNCFIDINSKGNINCLSPIINMTKNELKELYPNNQQKDDLRVLKIKAIKYIWD